MGMLWFSGFILGVSMFTPISSFQLAIDYYELAFPGAQLAVKVTICYEVSFATMQVLCHLLDARISRHVSRAARVEARHVVLAVFMAFVIAWDQLIVGGDLANAPRYAPRVLLALVTLSGAADGLAVGALFGEAAVLGPATVHALVAGTAGVMPLLALLRVIFKAALPATTAGLRLSVVLYFACAVLVLLTALGFYVLVIAPSIAAVTHAAGGGAQESVASTATKLGRELDDALHTLPLVPTLTLSGGVRGGTSTATAPTSPAGSGGGGSGGGNGPLQYTLSLPASMRGMPVLVRRVRAPSLDPEELRVGSMTSSLRPPAPGAPAPGVLPSSGSFGRKGRRGAGGSGAAAAGAAAPPGGGRPGSWLEKRRRAIAAMHVQHSVQMPAPSRHSGSSAAPPAVNGAGVVVDDRAAAADAGASPATSKEDDGGGGGASPSPPSLTSASAFAAQPAHASARPVSATGGSPFLWVGAFMTSRVGSWFSGGSATAPPAAASARHSARSARSGGSSAAATVGTSAAVPEHSAVVSVLPPLPTWAAAGVGSGPLPPDQVGKIGTRVSLAQLHSCQAADAVGPMLAEMLSRVAECTPLEPRYFVPGASVWRQNWSAVKHNWQYCLATVLTYFLSYAVFPSYITFVNEVPALMSWYPLLLVAAYGVGDLCGKLLPVWGVQRPQRAALAASVVRVLVFIPVFAVALMYDPGPSPAAAAVFFPLTVLLALSACYETTIFARACEVQHPLDALQLESLLAICLDIGIMLGSAASLAWEPGPWANSVSSVNGGPVVDGGGGGDAHVRRLLMTMAMLRRRR